MSRNRHRRHRNQWVLLAAIILVTPFNIFADEIDFNRDVRPILADTCFECHGPDEESRQADLRLDVLEDAVGWIIDAGRPEASLLVERLLSEDPHEVMPPPESKRRPIHDLNATVLHQLGIHHNDLTYRFQGRDFRLTDLAGRVVKEILT